MFLWLSRRDLKAETKNEITAAQDQALQTKYHVRKILQTETTNADYVNNLTRQYSTPNAAKRTTRKKT